MNASPPRTFRHVVAGLAMVCALISATPSPVAAQQRVSFVGDPWPPYVNGQLGNLAEGGIAVELVRRIFARIDGAEAVFPLIPWKRALLEVEHGDSDGIAILLKTGERERYLAYSVPLLTGHSRLWYLAQDDGGGGEWTEYDDLSGLRIGVVADYSYGAELDSRFASGRLVAVQGPTIEQLFAMLAAGRIDRVIATEAVGYAVLRNQDQARIRAAARSLQTETFYLALSKRSPAVRLLPQIDAAIAELRADGVIDRLLRGEIRD